MQKPSATYDFEAIGTHWWIELIGVEKFDHQLANELVGYADTFDKMYSRFMPTSLIGRLNNGESFKNPPSELLDMFSFAREMYEVSEGAFDITVGGKLHEFGYGSRTQAAPVNYSFWDTAVISKQQVRLPPHTVIDFGGFGKGWLIDQLVAICRARYSEPFIVNGGGDLYVHSDEPIEIGLEHPRDERYTIGTVAITKGALGVSSPYKRTWEHEGKTYHHLIDPRTGDPSTSQVASTYVRADTALIADTMASIMWLRPDLDETLSKRFHLKTIVLRKAQLG